MERFERLVVQIDESNKLLARGGQSRWRISLLLLDNTAELLLKIQCDGLLAFNRLRRTTLAMIEEAIKNGETYDTPAPFDADDEPRLLTEYRDELRRETVSDDELRRINDRFDAKLRYLARNEQLDNKYVAVLTRLHRYRNEAYHEDKIRPETVEYAAKVYTCVVCDLMRSTTPSWLHITAKTPDLDKIFPPPKAGRHIGHDFTQPYADALLAQSPVGPPTQLAEALSAHLVDRFATLDSDLDYIANGGLTAERTTTERAETLDRVVAFHNKYQKSTNPPGKVSTANYKKLRRWRRAAEQVADMSDYVTAFDKFASIEVPLESVEEICGTVVRALDEHIENEVDRLRGN